MIPAPNDHFTAGPRCRVTGSSRSCVSRAGACPTIRAGIVSAAGVVITPAPNDHFTAGPHCRVTDSARGRVGGAGGRPGIITAAALIGDRGEAIIARSNCNLLIASAHLWYLLAS